MCVYMYTHAVVLLSSQQIAFKERLSGSTHHQLHMEQIIFLNLFMLWTLRICPNIESIFKSTILVLVADLDFCTHPKNQNTIFEQNWTNQNETKKLIHWLRQNECLCLHYFAFLVPCRRISIKNHQPIWNKFMKQSNTEWTVKANLKAKNQRGIVEREVWRNKTQRRVWKVFNCLAK